MPVYNFKKIGVVPSAKVFIDIVLSKTQRKTPTVVHKGYAISRIRKFYMRKVKYTQQNWHEKLSSILEEFPRVDDIHPFYSDLLNVLYDKDHYKLALGQLNMARNLIDKVTKDYVRMMKYADSLYRCKTLKKAALGRMCTVMKKQNASLTYLDQVRQHMSRLPSIDPNTRTLLVCGYPNVGKSSFMNKVTRADVEVQPYAFTTKSLFVGHTDYKYLRWQVIDTPGILDRPLEERNTIEMQSITALAHLRACVMYLVDISELCGYSIKQQAALFHSIKPLFANKPLMIVCNKTDVVPISSLAEEDKELLRGMHAAACEGMEADQMDGVAGDLASIPTMSVLTEESVSSVKQLACEMLLRSRVEMKLKGKSAHEVLNRIHVAMPTPRDSETRPAVIPTDVAEMRARRAAGERRETEKDLQEKFGGAGAYSADFRKKYDLENDDWKYDIMPEILDGHNVLDFIDPDIEAKLDELEREEEELQRLAELEGSVAMDDEESDLEEEETELLGEIKRRKAKIISKHRKAKATADNAPKVARKMDKERVSNTSTMRTHMNSMGIDPTAAVERARTRSKSREGRKRQRDKTEDAEMGQEGDEEGRGVSLSRVEARSVSRGRSQTPGSGIKDLETAKKALKIADKMQYQRNKTARRGEGDRHVPDLHPKHLLTGKRGIGKTDRR